MQLRHNLYKYKNKNWVSIYRYYVCQWVSCGEKTRLEYGKEKCPLPYINAKHIEPKIWNSFMTELVRNKKKLLEPLIGPVNYDYQIEIFKTKINKLERDLRNLRRSKKRLYIAYEDGHLNLNDILQRIKLKESNIFGIETLLSEAKRNVKEIKKLKTRESLSQNSEDSNEGRLNRIINNLSNLGAKDKKAIMEDITIGKIRVDYYEENGQKCWRPHHRVLPVSVRNSIIIGESDVELAS